MNYLCGIPPQNIEETWAEVSLIVEAACEYNGGRYTADDCLKELLACEKQLWLVKCEESIRAVVITGIAPFPQMKCCTIDICTGEGLEEWKHLLAIIEHWASTQGCQQMFLIARPGMRKALRDLGYRKTHELLEKMLSDKC